MVTDEELRLLKLAHEMSDHLVCVVSAIRDFAEFLENHEGDTMTVLERYSDPTASAYLGLGCKKLGEAMHYLEEHVGRQTINIQAEMILMGAMLRFAVIFYFAIIIFSISVISSLRTCDTQSR